MKTKLLILIVLGLAFVSQSCNNDDDPYIIIKDSNTEIISQDTIEVESQSVQELLIEAGYKVSSPSYLRQINNNDLIDISDSSDVDVYRHGSSGINFENVKLTTNISDMDLTKGSIIKTTVRLGSDMSKSIYYKIK